MCGYCIEIIALDILQEDSQGILQLKKLFNGICYYFYLRETSDFIPALEKTRRSLAQKKLISWIPETERDTDMIPVGLRKKPFFDVVPHSVLLYRGLEILFNQGFDSPAYQRLLKMPLYREAVAVCCNNKMQHQFTLLTEGLEVDHLALLYDAETYFRKKNSKRIQLLSNSIQACLNLLKHYKSWWLDGKKMKKVDLVAQFKELGIWDQIHEGYMVQTKTAKLARALDYRFTLLTNAIYFGILVVGSCQAGKNIMLALAQKNRPVPLDSTGNELWLQRLAALKLYDLEGFDSFSTYMTTIRATCYYYIDLVRGFSVEQKRLLLEEARRNPEIDRTDDSLCMSEWLSTGHVS